MVRVAAAQIKVTGSIDKNLRTILSFINKAARKQAKIVCFPEVCLGFDETKITNIHPHIRQIQERCRQRKIYCIFGSYVKERGKVFNAVFLVDSKGKIKYEYRKEHLWRTEKKKVTPGHRDRAVKTSFGKIGIIDCWDVAFPLLIRKLEREGAKIIFCPVFEGDYNRDREVTRKLPHVRAYENVVYFVLCDAFTSKTLAESCIYSPLKALAKIKKKEGLIVADLDMAKLTVLRKYYDCWKNF